MINKGYVQKKKKKNFWKLLCRLMRHASFEINFSGVNLGSAPQVIR